jgi:hypothetical protein
VLVNGLRNGTQGFAVYRLRVKAGRQLRTACRPSHYYHGSAIRGLAADNRQLGVPGSGSLLAFNFRGFGEASQRWLAQLKPDPLCGTPGSCRLEC